MDNTNIKEFTQLLTSVLMIYNQTLQKATFTLFWEILKPFEFKDVKAACLKHIKNPASGQFAPKPADLIRYIEMDHEIAALHAWTKIVHAIRQAGAYAPVVFDDELIHCVIVDMGGWVYLCRSLERDLPFRAKEFIQRYTSYCIHPPQHWANYLPAIINYTPDDLDEMLTFIGDTTRAQEIFNQGDAIYRLPQFRTQRSILSSQKLMPNILPENEEDA